MKRRTFITFIGGAAAWPLAARAQQLERARLVGIVAGFAEAEFLPLFTAFRDKLKDLGWAEGATCRSSASPLSPPPRTITPERGFAPPRHLTFVHRASGQLVTDSRCFRVSFKSRQQRQQSIVFARFRGSRAQSAVVLRLHRAKPSCGRGRSCDRPFGRGEGYYAGKVRSGPTRSVKRLDHP